VITEGVNGSVVSPTDTGAITSALERFRERSAAEVMQRLAIAEPHTYAPRSKGLLECMLG